MAADTESARAIFLEALDRSTPTERSAFVAEACGHDGKLERRVVALLRAHDAPFDMLDRPALEQFPLCPGGDPADAGGPSATVMAATARAGADEVLAILGPPTRTGSLGRLGHYEMLEVRGQGGFGTVFRSFDDKLHRIVAIKVLSPSLAASGTARQRFLREARAAAAVRHEHVVDIHAVEEEPVPFLVMEYIDGQTLQQKLDETGPLSLTDILRVGSQVAAGLAAAHRQGLIHRDIKPSNILLESQAERVKLSDFGLARAVDDASLTISGQITGTPMYMSPEQAESRPVDHRSDLFSLGSVVYTMCTGQPPFRAASGWAVLKGVCTDTPPPIRECNAEISEWLTAIVARLMAKQPEDRYARAQEVADTLMRHLHELHMRDAVELARTPKASITDVSPAPTLADTGGMAATPIEPLRRPRRLFRPRLRTALLAAGALGVILLAWSLRGRDVPEVEKDPPDIPVAKKEPRPIKPFAQWTRHDIPAETLAYLDSPEEAPPELVAVLGGVRFMMTGGRIGGIAADPDGRLLAAGCGTELLFFDVKTGRLLQRILGHPAQINHVVFATRGGKILTTCDDGIARLWEIESGKLLGTFEGHTAAVLAGCFTPDDRTVITGGADRTARVWDVAGKTMLQKLDHPEIVLGLAMSPDGKTLGTACRDTLVRIWDRANAFALRETLGGHGSDDPAVAFSPDGQWIVTGGTRVKVWEAGTLKPVFSQATRGNWLGFSKDNRTLLAAGIHYALREKYLVTRWELPTGQKLPSLTLHSSGFTGAFALSPDGTTFYSVRTRRGPRYARAYDLDTDKLRFPDPPGHRARVTRVDFSPDGAWLASGSDDRTVRLWQLAGRPEGDALPQQFALNHDDLVCSVCFSPDGKLLATASVDHVVILWDLVTRKPRHTLAGYTGVCRLAFSPDGKTIAAGLDDGAVKFWDVATGAEKDARGGHTGAVTCIAFSPDRKLLVSAGIDKTLQIRDSLTGKRVHSFVLPDRIDVLAFTGDGKRLFGTTEHDGAFRLVAWDVNTWQQTQFPGHRAGVPALALCPTAPLAATGSNDGAIRLWDLRETAPRTLTLVSGVRGDGPADLAFTHDGGHLAAANPNGAVTIFKIPPPGANWHSLTPTNP